MLRKFKKAQSIGEYPILLVVIVGAALAMQVYLKRSLNAKMKDAGDALTSVSGDITGEGVILGTTPQYEPYYLQSRDNTSDNTSKDSTQTTPEKTDEAFDTTTTQNITKTDSERQLAPDSEPDK